MRFEVVTCKANTTRIRRLGRLSPHFLLMLPSRRLNNTTSETDTARVSYTLPVTREVIRTAPECKWRVPSAALTKTVAVLLWALGICNKDTLGLFYAVTTRPPYACGR